MRTTRPLDSVYIGDRISLYEEILHGDYGGLDELAQKLGISARFRRVFPDDQSFWQSSLSLMQIYQDLSQP